MFFCFRFDIFITLKSGRKCMSERGSREQKRGIKAPVLTYQENILCVF